MFLTFILTNQNGGSKCYHNVKL